MKRPSRYVFKKKLKVEEQRRVRFPKVFSYMKAQNGTDGKAIKTEKG